MDIFSELAKAQGEKLLRAARLLAKEAHKDQEWGSKPYWIHLRTVYDVLRRYEVEAYDLFLAAWLHDSLEDTDVTEEQIEEHFGPEVLSLVKAVTDEPGKNRKERHEKTYKKIAGNSKATVLKLADRITNVEESWATQDRRLFMYQKEYRGFRKALRRDLTEDGLDSYDYTAREMWDHLDYLLGWWEPPKS
jgi:(p)ppGpp synthase/HD superfamily hydrolase